LIAAVGPLSMPKPPDFPGLADFAGRWEMTSAWPHEPIDMAGKRVAVIGTGSSGIQSIPVIAEQAARLTVFQRTPNFSLPARNGPHDPAYEALARSDYAAHCQRNRDSRGGVQPKYSGQPGALEVDEAARLARYEEAWDRGGASMQSAFRDLISDVAANDTVADFVRGKIRTIVADAEVAERLSPHDHPLGTKRICLDTDYYATFNRPDVTLIDIRSEPIERIVPEGIVTVAGLYPADLIVFATGFDAMTGPLLAMNIEGPGGHRFRDAWAYGPATYLGLMVAGFPNLFLVNGPGSPSVLCNMLVAVEQHVDWIAAAIAHLRETGHSRIEALPEAQAAWVDEVRLVADRTLYPRANSWYNGDNVPGKTRVFLPYVGGFDTYTRRCEDVVADGYAGFRLSPA
jgi:cyclohexanone monooxygenase